MRYATFTIAFFLIGLLQVNAQNNCKIEFEFRGMANGHARLIGILGDQNYLIDSFPTQSGKAVFEQAEPLPGGLYYFVFPDHRTFVQFLVDKHQTFSLKSQKTAIFNKMEVKNNPDTELFYTNQRFEQAWKIRYDSTDRAIKNLPVNDLNKPFLQTKLDNLVKARKAEVQRYSQDYPESFFTIFKTAGQNPSLTYPKTASGNLDTLAQLVAYRNAYWNGTNLTDERLLRTPVVANKLKTYIEKLTPQNPDSLVKYADRVIRMSLGNDESFKYVSNYIAIKYEKPKMMGGEKILVHIVDNFFTDELAFWYKENPDELRKIRKKVNDMRPSMVGKIGQDIRCQNIKGEYENLYGMGAPIKVLFMYSYTCEHCRERAPVLVELMKEWRSKGVEVMALCIDPELDKWKEFVATYKMEELHNVIDPDYESRYYRKYHIDITPEAYVLDKNNIIVAKDLHPNQLASVFKKLK